MGDLIKIKELDTEEGRREYYTYDPRNPATLRPHAEPYLDPRFNAELLEIFGTDVHGDPRLRIVWGGSTRASSFREMEDGSVLEYDGMRYPYMRLRIIRGYNYYDKKGRKVMVTSLSRVPPNTVFTEAIGWDDLGVMKFVLEMKYTAEELVKLGRYPKPGSDEEKNWCVRDGKRYRRKPDPNGDYLFCHYIETSDGRFADVTQITIDNIRAIFHRATTETEAEYVKRKLAEREQLAIAEKEQENLNYANHVENARIRAEKKLAKGKIIYSHG